jgi:negative regulator of replication initiation
MAKKTEPILVACYDRERRTCLQVLRCDKTVAYIPLDISTGLEVIVVDETDFDRRYQPMVDYPAERAAQLYLGYAQTIGASTEALDYLGRVINITTQERNMATAKKKAAAAAKTEKQVKTTTKTAKVADKATKAKTGDGAKRATAAQLFKDLIMAGKHTDDQIFKQVQEKFGLDDKKRGYVAWYRNHLVKEGAKPPKAKE